MQSVTFLDLGLIPYKEAWDYQEKLFQEIVNRKIKNRALVSLPDSPVSTTPETNPHTAGFLLFCEHPHVYTLGKSGEEKNLLLDEAGLKNHDATFYKINRGGDITYHGPGQIVGYPILDLDYFFTDIHKYLRLIEESIILTLADYGLKAGRYHGFTGVWLDPADPVKARKICAIGVRSSRWVTMHGFAFNVSTDLNYFNHIIPCGINDKTVTSLEKELGLKPDLNEVKEKVKMHFASLFKIQFQVVKL